MVGEDMTEKEIAELEDELEGAGYSPPVAEALAANNVNAVHAAILSKREVLEYWLEWNGIIGYTDQILNTIANAEANCNM
jgi:hypothetical protein